MFNKNDVIHWRDADYRLLGVVANQAILFPMNEAGIALVKAPESELSAAEQNGAAVLTNDPYAALQFKTPSGKAAEKTQENLKLIEPVLSLGDEMLANDKARSQKLNELSGGDPSRRRKAVRVLSAYFKKGQCENALQPEYGKNTAPRECVRKPGRRFKDASVCPPPVNEELRKLFVRIIERHVLKNGGLSLAKAHSLLVTDYLAKHPGTTPATAPSINQFRYFYRRYKTFPEKLRAKTPAIEYEKDKRSLHGTTYDIVDGIGHIYEVDATIAGVYLVAETDRTRLIGQPTLYVVTDIYSRKIVGVHIAVEAAQFAAAAVALTNAFESKAAYLEANSDHLDAKLWEASGLPHTLTADNAELSGQQIEAFCRSSGVRISNTKAYRGDQKGTIERSIGLIQERVEPHIEAKPSPHRLKKEGRVEMRDKASLTLSEYRKLVLNAIVDINNRALELVPPDYPSTNLPTPNAIWDWCQSAGGGRSYLRRPPKGDLLERALMPRFEATVSREGIKAEKLLYACDKARELGWMERDRHAPRPKKPRLAIDPNNVSRAWLFPDEDTAPADAWPCRLASQSNRFERMPLFEARSELEALRISNDRAVRAHAEIQGRMYRRNEAIAKEAKQAKPKDKPSLKAALENLADNRRRERSYQARKAQDPAAAPETLKQPQAEAPANPYEYPDIDDLE